MASRNPFKPSIGVTPPVLIGRDIVLDEVREALDMGPGAPGRTAIFTGARGVGKTVMLNAVEQLATEAGWVYISETATPGLLSRLDEHLDDLLSQLRRKPRAKVTGVTLPASLGGLDLQHAEDEGPTNTRRRLTAVLDILEAADSGLMITLDEVHGGVREELRELGALHQHMIRENRDLSLMMAGLPAAISSLLADRILTFLRRADKQHLLDVPVEDVQEAFVKTVRDAGRRISEEDAQRAAEATAGYPFLIQLVGYRMWQAAEGDEIDRAAVERGITAARSRLGTLVHEPALHDLSDVDRAFLTAMSQDTGPSKMYDIRERMKAPTPQYANTYRKRLIEAGMIRQVGRGKVDFAMPYLRDYLREHPTGLS